MELENRLKGRLADKNRDTKCHSSSVSERRSHERCDTDSGTSGSKKREMQDSHSSEDDGLRDAEIEEFLHSRSIFLLEHLFVHLCGCMHRVLNSSLPCPFLVSQLRCVSPC